MYERAASWPPNGTSIGRFAACQVCSGIISAANRSRNAPNALRGSAGLITNLVRPASTCSPIIRRASGQLTATRLAGSASGLRSRAAAIKASGMPSVATARLIP